MNPLNYASLEASKRLVDAGILLETDHSWVWMLPDARTGHAIDVTWRVKSISQYGKLPAPSMAEVWRELPPQGCYLTANQGYYYAWIVWTGFEGYEKSYDVKEYTNPTDALISLLIWVRKENNAS